ncbi:MAG: hypothetical protein IKU38_04120 [Clostridia bacterium]|nr:hypothetical protein [Clostridia bacterium]
MTAVSIALALLGSVIGAGFASGREILRFFAGHGRMAPAAIACALAMLAALFFRLPAQMHAYGAPTLAQLCRLRLGRRFGTFCGALFMLLCAITGAAMLAACAELGALLLPFAHAYAFSMAFSLLLALALAFGGAAGLAAPGAALVLLLPLLLMRLLALPAGEACFLPAMTPDLPVRAIAEGTAYGALSAAQLAGMLALLTAYPKKTRQQAVLLFVLLFGGMLSLGTAVCRRHLPAIIHQPLPFVYLSRPLGAAGYTLVALCLYAAALSTLCAMLRALMPQRPHACHACPPALCCLIPSLLGFDQLIAHGYPLLGALCAGLLLVLCLPSRLPLPEEMNR